MSREDRILEKLRELRREIIRLLAKGPVLAKSDKEEASVEIPSQVPDFVRENLGLR